MNGRPTRRRGPLLWPRDRTRRFWLVCLVIGVPILYVVCFGPACWLTSRLGVGFNAMSFVYRPAFALWWDGPPVIRDAIGFWAGLGTPDGCGVMKDGDNYLWGCWSSGISVIGSSGDDGSPGGDSVQAAGN